MESQSHLGVGTMTLSKPISFLVRYRHMGVFEITTNFSVLKNLSNTICDNQFLSHLHGLFDATTPKIYRTVRINNFNELQLQFRMWVLNVDQWKTGMSFNALLGTVCQQMWNAKPQNLSVIRKSWLHLKEKDLDDVQPILDGFYSKELFLV